MSLRLTVLGGSAAWPNPGQGCSSYLVRAGSANILLDCGPDTLLELRRHVALDSLDAIVISHCHADHILDLVTLRYALVYGAEKPATPVPLWLPPDGASILRELGDVLGAQGETAGSFWDTAFVLGQYDPEGTLELAGCRISFAATQHFTRCFAIRLETHDGSTIVYGADTGRIDSLIGFARGAHLLVAEATADSHGDLPVEERGHLTPEDAGEWAERAGVPRLVVTHLWHERPTEVVVQRVASKFKGIVDIAARGATYYV
jgi:ribonuclease BN (tRNA processing enzyme)